MPPKPEFPELNLNVDAIKKEQLYKYKKEQFCRYIAPIIKFLRSTLSGLLEVREEEPDTKVQSIEEKRGFDPEIFRNI